MHPRQHLFPYYSVPRRFGIGASLIMMACFCALFAAMRSLQIPLEFQAFGVTFVVAIALAQMFLERVPRAASIAVGALFLTAAVHLHMWRLGGASGNAPFLLRLAADGNWRSELWLIVIGGFVGYLGGTLIASVFLIADGLARVLRRQVER